MKLFGSGSWYCRSESDPRWDASGDDDCVSALAKPQALLDHVEKLKRELGCGPPADLKYGVMKD